jgi:alpha-ketoglutarate-dependent taurine dioxygenase
MRLAILAGLWQSAVMGELKLETLGGRVGAEIFGVDADRLLNDESLPGHVLDALEGHGALVFRDLHLDDATQVAFSKRLGRVEILGKGEHPEIFRVTLDPAKNPAASYLRGTFDWHIDGMTEDIPIMATLLSAHAVATAGGETEFASTYAAYDELREEEKVHCLQLRVVHTFEHSQRLVNNNPTPEELALWRKRPPKTHPLVWTHRSGRRSLVLGATATEVVGMAPAAGEALLDELLARATAPGRIYRHAWAVGDLVIWDNRGVLHRACRYEATSPRDMHRTTLYGDEPVQ